MVESLHNFVFSLNEKNANKVCDAGQRSAYLYGNLMKKLYKTLVYGSNDQQTLILYMNPANVNFDIFRSLSYLCDAMK